MISIISRFGLWRFCFSHRFSFNSCFDDRWRRSAVVALHSWRSRRPLRRFALFLLSCVRRPSFVRRPKESLAMPVDRELLLDAVSTVARNRNVLVSAQQSAKAGAIAGSSVLVGTLLGGPVGLVLGGIIGTTLAYKSAGPVRPLWEILNEEMTQPQKEQLVAQLSNAFRDVQFTDLAMLATLILRSSSLQDTAMRVALDFARSQITF